MVIQRQEAGVLQRRPPGTISNTPTSTATPRNNNIIMSAAAPKQNSPWPSQEQTPANGNVGAIVKGGWAGLTNSALSNISVAENIPQSIGSLPIVGGAKNVAAFEQYRNFLRVSEQANPLVNSLQSSGSLPSNFVTKSTAMGNGWAPGKALENSMPGHQIGGDTFLNNGSNGSPLLPDNGVRTWKEADVGLTGTMSRAKQPGNRLLYSDDGHMYLSTDHYKSYDNIGNYLDGGNPVTGGASSVSSTLGKIGKVADVGGKAMGVFGAAMDGYELYSSYQADGGKIGENTVTSAGGITGSWAGAALGAKGGALGGAAVGTAICPIIGTAIGGFLGGLAGGILGGLGGRWAGEEIAGALYD